MKRLATVALLLGLLPAAGAQTVAINAAQRDALGIEVKPLQTVDVSHSPLLPAKVTVPNAQLQVVTAPQEGLVEVLLVAEGDEVNEGQALVRIQSPRLLDLQSQYLETHTRYLLAEGNYRRDRQLREEGIIAERRLLESQASYRELATARSRLRQLLELSGMDEAALDTLQRKRELSSTLLVRAPIDGVVLEQLVTAGTRVEAADPLYRIADLDPLWLEIHVPLDRLGDTGVGDTVTVPGTQIRGRIIAVGRMVHGADQGVLVRAEIHAEPGVLRPGQFLQAQLSKPTEAHRFRIPRTAVVRNQGKSYVFVESGSEGFTAAQVRVSDEQATHLVIEADLSPDSRIAISGAAAIKAIWAGE